MGLTVEWAATLDAIQDVGPQDEMATFAVVRVSISNDTSGSIPVGATHFSIATDNGLEILSTPTSSLLAGYCGGEISVVAGAAHTCEVAFERGASARPTELRYDSGVGTKAQASLSMDDPSPMCGLYCSRLGSRASQLKCAPFDTAACTADCKGILTKALGNGCVGEVQAVNVCVLGLPDSAFSCPPGIELSVSGDCGNAETASNCFH